MNNIIKNRMRKSLRSMYLSVIGCFSTPSNYVHILNGHMLNRENITEKDIKRYEHLLDALSRDCDFVNFEDAVSMIVNKVKVSKPAIAFSFDDGFDDCYYIAPTLEKYNVNAIFFVNPNFVTSADNNDEEYIKNFTDNITLSPGKRPMSWDQIKDLEDRGFIIGAHTMDHYLTAKDDENELRYQIVECRRVIEERLSKSCDYFAWPYGRIEHTSQKAVELACDTYKYVFSQTDYRHYFSFNGKVINRRHFEPFWPISHVKYFISKNKQ